ncbi:hypothetical protein NG895_21705 [Aeoliella sp. ICT_H6.2]|uniref:Uncharacterized protein n=1 Tax=Aeoliella straminimaris TaxID=2954799 RepID=A0A9X2FEG0_9BACT|nr:hypothetical protein [Aeoliella straminimaris]MCO6046522.1 hypothetical protein [Aeoliella straminimaris]
MAGTPDPTPEEIRAACERIQATWSKHDWRNRAVTNARKWKLPSYSTSKHADGSDGLEVERD